MANLGKDMSGAVPVERVTKRSSELGAALRGLRTGACMNGREFIVALTAANGPHLDRAQLSRIESGERGLTVSQWHQLLRVVARLDVPADVVATLAALLPSPALIEQLPQQPLGKTLDRWYAIARELSGRPAPRIATTSEEAPPKRGVAATMFMARYREPLAEIVKRANLATMPADAVPGDDAQVVDIEPPETEVPPNGPFEVRIRLRNSGVGWWGENRLLLRLGPPISSTIAQTAPLLPVPATAPGDTCDILVPGRGHYLPGRCIVTYVMTFANGRPCLPGGLSLPIITVARLHTTLSLSEQLARLFRTRNHS